MSTQHAEDIEQDALREAVIEHGHPPGARGRRAWRSPTTAEIYVNPTGRFVIGGPMGDAGLTGRKIIVDTYGGMGRHGGGAFSGKDCTKVDRSAAYAARWVAKNVVAAGLADRCEVQIAYAIGVAKPGVASWWRPSARTMSRKRIIERAVSEVFDLRPGAIIDELDLRRPIYQQDGGLRPLRPRASRVHLGEDRPRRRPAGGLRGRVTWLRLSRRGDARHSDSLRQSSLATPSVGGDLGRPSQPGNAIPLERADQGQPLRIVQQDSLFHN